MKALTAVRGGTTGGTWNTVTCWVPLHTLRSRRLPIADPKLKSNGKSLQHLGSFGFPMVQKEQSPTPICCSKHLQRERFDQRALAATADNKWWKKDEILAYLPGGCIHRVSFHRQSCRRGSRHSQPFRTGDAGDRARIEQL